MSRYIQKCFIAQNAYCSRDIYLQFMKYLHLTITLGGYRARMKYLRSVILPIIIQTDARRCISLIMLVKIIQSIQNARFYPKEYDLAYQLEEGGAWLQ